MIKQRLFKKKLDREEYLIPNKDDHLYRNEDILIGNAKE